MTLRSPSYVEGETLESLLVDWEDPLRLDLQADVICLPMKESCLDLDPEVTLNGNTLLVEI